MEKSKEDREKGVLGEPFAEGQLTQKDLGGRIFLFAGTTEGRQLAGYLKRQQIPCRVMAATEYGGWLLDGSSGETGRKDEAGKANEADGANEADKAHEADGANEADKAHEADKTNEADIYQVAAGRMDREQMRRMFEEEKPVAVIDATHPYAVAVSENISSACACTGTEYVRLIRSMAAWKSGMAAESREGSSGEASSREKSTGEKSDRGAENREASEADGCIWVDSVKEAVRYLQRTKGNILVTTGSKELSAYTELEDWKNRVYARILSVAASMEEAVRLGFTGSHLICMQGPFSEEMNLAMLRQTGAEYLVTKESGTNGGFLEKIRAAKSAGAKAVIIGRPRREEGKSLEEVKHWIAGKMGIQVKRRIDLIGIGMGNPENMTIEARKACEEAQVLIGAGRMLEAAEAAGLKKPFYASYKAEEIYRFMQEHPEYDRTAVLLSGDVGFYSGAKKLFDLFQGEKVHVYSGISSVVYLCGKLHTSWEDARLLSLHGRTANIVTAVDRYPKVFALVGEKGKAAEVCRKLCEYGLSDVMVSVGEELSYEKERIVTGRAEELQNMEFAPLGVMLFENPAASHCAAHGIRDDAFIRAKVPMTKEEVRSVSLSKLMLKSDSIVYDVGAGTGSVSIEMALQAEEGHVYAVEKKEEAADLIKENKRKFRTDHVTVVRGLAPEALEGLPAPTHAFIGGSSGNLREILACILTKNPKTRIVINAIVLETVSEALACIKSMGIEDADIVSLSCAKAKTAGPYHMMMGMNPVYVISFTGGGADA